jgi:hypothetical protein
LKLQRHALKTYNKIGRGENRPHIRSKGGVPAKLVSISCAKLDGARSGPKAAIRRRKPKSPR